MIAQNNLYNNGYAITLKRQCACLMNFTEPPSGRAPSRVGESGPHHRPPH
jgi:hypothetical protein